VSRELLDAIDRGLPEPDLPEVQEAARRAAFAEDRVIFHGLSTAAIVGVADAAPLQLTLDDNYSAYPTIIANAVARLKAAGVAGPYAIALGPRCYAGVIETTEHGGYPVLEHLRLILGGPVEWAPAVDGAVVISQRGGDFTITPGADFAIGYLGHDANGVDCYLEESLTFRISSPDAAVALVYAS
jgi:uncharacterized linocin/CFP29 family protein